jgi:hypothetical protein
MSQYTQKGIFREVVKMGLGCGLKTPQEWVQNYLMHFTQWTSYVELEQVKALISLVETEFVALTLGINDDDVKQEHIDTWYKEVYGDR